MIFWITLIALVVFTVIERWCGVMAYNNDNNELINTKISQNKY